MARSASPQKSARSNTPNTQATLCAALSEVSLNKVSTKVPPKLKPSSPPRKITVPAEGHANEQSSLSRRQRVFRLEHVDSLTLPSLNGTSSKSYEQSLSSQGQNGARSDRSPVRATPRRVAKQTVSYAVPGLLGLQAELSDSDWSGREQSDDEEDSDLELDQTRLLWRSPSKTLTGQVLKPMSIVDLTSPSKPAAPKPAEPVRPQPPRQRSSTLDSVEDNLAILSLSVHPIPFHSPLKQTTNTSQLPTTLPLTTQTQTSTTTTTSSASNTTTTTSKSAKIPPHVTHQSHPHPHPTNAAQCRRRRLLESGDCQCVDGRVLTQEGACVATETVLLP